MTSVPIGHAFIFRPKLQKAAVSPQGTHTLVKRFSVRAAAFPFLEIGIVNCSTLFCGESGYRFPHNAPHIGLYGRFFRVERGGVCNQLHKGAFIFCADCSIKGGCAAVLYALLC